MDLHKKKRAPNFTTSEKDRIITLVGKYRNILENKKTDSVLVSSKNEAWFKLTQEFNALAPNNVFRTTESLKKFWDNAKEDLRKRAGEEKRSLYKTGGGPPKYSTKPEDELMLDVVNIKTIVGLTNPYDSDFNTVDDTQGKTLDESQLIDPLEENNTEIEIVYEEPDKGNIEKRDTNVTEESTSGGNYKWATKATHPDNLKTPINRALKRNLSKVTGIQGKNKKQKSITPTRRRPTTIRVLSSSILAEKYEILIDKKIELANGLQKEHELRMKLLRFDLLMKKRELQALGYTNVDIEVLDINT